MTPRVFVPKDLEAERRTIEYLDEKISVAISVALVSGSNVDDPTAWNFTLTIENLTKNPVEIPSATINPNFDILDIFKSGEELPYTSFAERPSNADWKQKLIIPPGLLIRLAFPIPHGNSFRFEPKRGVFVVKWRYHKEAAATFRISKKKQLSVDGD